MPPPFRTVRTRATFVGLALIAACWALLYLPNLRTSPPWYGDETLALGAALNLTQGTPADQAVRSTFWHPAIPYQPLYLALVGAGARLCGGDIVGARLVNALLALATATVLFHLGQRRIGFAAALFAALLFLSFGQSLVHFRAVFTHNLVALGFAFAFLSLPRRPDPRREWRAGLGLAAAACALPIFLYGAAAAFLLRINRPRSLVRLLLPPALAVAASLALGGLAAGAFLKEDLAAMVRFYATSTHDNSGGSLLQAPANFAAFFLQGGWHAAGLLLMLLSLLDRRTRAVGAAGLIVTVFLPQNRNLGAFHHQAVGLLPFLFFAYGAGHFLLFRRLRRRIGRSSLRFRLAQAAAFVLPLAAFLPAASASLEGRVTPRNAYWTTQSSAEVEQAAAWLNARVAPGDLVICNTNLAWLLRARTADFVQSAAYGGLAVWPYLPPPPRAEFRYAADPASARFVVVGDIDRRYVFGLPAMAPYFSDLSRRHFVSVWHGLYYMILQNPNPPSR